MPSRTSYSSGYRTTTTDSNQSRAHPCTEQNFTLPPGVRDEGLLESAVSRQWTGIGSVLKYPAPIENAATLLYGICGNHPFHNGNKRTALVCMLAHFDKNKFALFGTTQKDLFDLMVDVASHRLGVPRDRRRRRPISARNPDQEIDALIHWIAKRASRVTRGEKQISYRQLKNILEKFGYELASPKNNYIDIIRREIQTKGIIRKRKLEVVKRIGNIPYPGERRDVGLRHIKYVREMCGLREEDGVDSDSFYSYTDIIGGFVNHYRGVLRNLART